VHPYVDLTTGWVGVQGRWLDFVGVCVGAAGGGGRGVRGCGDGGMLVPGNRGFPGSPSLGWRLVRGVRCVELGKGGEMIADGVAYRTVASGALLEDASVESLRGCRPDGSLGELVSAGVREVEAVAASFPRASRPPVAQAAPPTGVGRARRASHPQSPSTGSSVRFWSAPAWPGSSGCSGHHLVRSISRPGCASVQRSQVMTISTIVWVVLLSLIFCAAMIGNVHLIIKQIKQPERYISLIHFAPGMCILVSWALISKSPSIWMLLVIPVFDPLGISCLSRIAFGIFAKTR